MQAQTQEILEIISLQLQQQSLEQEQPSPSNNVWVYVPQTSMAPSPQYPIVQSYVDTIVRGCLEYDEQMAMEFLTTTLGWYPSHTEHHLPHPNEADSLDEMPEQNENDNNQSNSHSTDRTMAFSSPAYYKNMRLPRITLDESTIAPILDDRNDPVYIRGDPEWSRQNANRIDEILEHVRPDLLACRREFTSYFRTTQ
jgi:hypothetical protein